MKACSAYAEELANCAATGETPDSRLRAHLLSCAECRATLNEIQRVAALNSQVAAQLPEPSRSISVDTVFLKALEQRRVRSPWPVSILSAVAACAVVLLAVWGLQKKPTPTVVAVDVPKTETTWEPTWQRLREEVRSDTFTANRGSGAVVAHYRVKDAYSDLN